MCGRARCTLSSAQAARAFGFLNPTPSAGGGGAGGGGDAPAVPTLQMDRFRPSYNLSPGAYLPVGVVRARTVGGDGDGGAEEQGPMIQCMKWGLVPSFTGKTEKPDHFRMFNARSESIKEKASFRRLIPKNRCLVAVEGFYEWKKDGSKKQPYYIHFQDQRPLVFAAIFDTWKSLEGETLHTFTILTTRASTSLKCLHDRMPVILGGKDSINAWLNNASVKLEEITVPYEGADLVWYPVTTSMGKTSFDGLECVKELQLRTNEKPISNFFTKNATSCDQPVLPDKIPQNLVEIETFRTLKEECDESGEIQLVRANQQHLSGKQDASSIGEDEPVTLGLQGSDKDQSIKQEDIMPDGAIQTQEAFNIKRKIEDIEVNSEMKMENISMSPFIPMKRKGKGAKVASDGQASLLSYFAKK